MDTIQSKFHSVQDQIRKTLERCGRADDKVDLLAVSKTQPMNNLETVARAGQCLFGENRVQEFMTKIEDVQEADLFRSMEVHLIGSLQRNKVQKALEHFSCIQSVDRLELLEKIRDEVEKTDSLTKPYPVFLQVRSSDFDFKHGFDSFSALQKATEQLLSYQSLRFRGLMVIGPFSSEEAVLRKAFAQTRTWAEKLQTEFALQDSLDLSMGMSDDFVLAIEEGSSMVRVGSGIFGKRS